MRLYILRHGEAALIGVSDSERPLTGRGRSQTRLVLDRVMGHIPNNIGNVFASPKLRAQQTCEIACDILGYKGEVATTDLLKPGGCVDELTDFLEHFKEEQNPESALLVTHQPLAGSLLEFLTDNQSIGSLMETSCMACLDVTAWSCGGGVLEWLEAPE